MKKHSFYLFSEHSDFVWHCLRAGMKPTKYSPYCRSYVEEFDFDGEVYRTFTVHECYSGFALTIAAVSCLKYDKLIEILFTTKSEDDMIGCLGMLLRYYPEEFQAHLAGCPSADRRVRKIKKLIVTYLAQECYHVREMTQLLEICRT